MKVFIKGKGQVDLTQNDYLAEGGQGKVYAKGNTVYKVYHDASKMIPSAKIQELAVLTSPNILKPEDILLDSKNKQIGYTMRYVPNTHPLCKLFTKAFRQRESITDVQMLNLVRDMQQSVIQIHNNHVLIVDLNEMNFLVTPDFRSVLFIDVDSYQTPSYHATALMESVRDRHMTPGKFTQLTDWFSFAVVSFQMFIGIHPYKGKHPKFTDAATAMEDRMKANISVLNPEVAVPAVCQPFSVIPKVYLDWYTRVLEKGERLPPPLDLNAAIVLAVKVQKVSGSNIFDIAEIAKVDKDIIAYYNSGSNEVIVTEDSVYLNGRQDALNVKKPVFGFTPKMNHPVSAHYAGGLIHITDLIGQQELFSCAGKTAMSYDNRIYVQNDTHILEVQFYETGNKTIASVRQVGNIMEKATQMFEGVVIQNLMGSYYASIFPTTNNCHQFPLKELNGYKILDAKFDHGVMMIVGSKGGKYDRFVLRFNSSWEYDVRQVKDITYSGLNFTVLENGICICIDEEERVEVFSNAKDRADVKVIDDPAVDSSMKLFHRGTRLMFAKGNKMFSMTMRKK